MGFRFVQKSSTLIDPERSKIQNAYTSTGNLKVVR